MQAADLAALNVDEINRPVFAVHLNMEQFSTEWHRHKKHQLLYAEGGVVYLQTNEQTMLLPARHGAWIPSEVFHRVYSNSNRLYLRMLYFERLEPEKFFFRKLHVFPISSLAREMILHTERWPMDAPLSDAEYTFFKSIRYLVAEGGKLSLPLVLPVPEHTRLRGLTDYMVANLDNPMSLREAAFKFGFSERTLMRTFRQKLGMTFSAYLRVARIIRALEYLAQPDATVTQAAFEVGYESLGSFSDAFQQIVGMRPQTYLKKTRRMS